MKIKDLLEIQSIIEKREVPCDMNGDLNQHFSVSKEEYIDILDMDLIHLVRSYSKCLDKNPMSREYYENDELEVVNDNLVIIQNSLNKVRKII